MFPHSYVSFNSSICSSFKKNYWYSNLLKRYWPKGYFNWFIVKGCCLWLVQKIVLFPHMCFMLWHFFLFCRDNKKAFINPICSFSFCMVVLQANGLSILRDSFIQLMVLWILLESKICTCIRESIPFSFLGVSIFCWCS